MDYLILKNVPISRAVKSLLKHSSTGEINIQLSDGNSFFAALEVRYPDARKDHLDGLTVMCDAWWFNVGASNTEPLMRLNLEANDVALRDKKRDEALRIIQKADPVMSIRQ